MNPSLRFNNGDPRLSNASLSALLYGILLACLLYVLATPLTTSVSTSVAILILFRFACLWYWPELLPALSRNAIKNLSSMAMTLLIISAGWQIGLLNAMVNLLMAGACLWWFTSPSPVITAKARQAAHCLQHASQKLTLCLLFLIAVAFIYEQSLQLALLYFLLLLINIYALLLAQNPALAPKTAGLVLLRHIAFALVIASGLFVITPNLAPFWKLPEQRLPTSGLSDTLSPGDIANLAKSNRLAFRASFMSQPLPEMSALYWRVMTMESFDGKTWRVDPRRREPTNWRQQKSLPDSFEHSYEIIAEPTQQAWLYALNNSSSPTQNVLRTLDNTLIYQSKVKQRIKYQAYAESLPLSQQKLNAWEWQRNRQLSPQAHPKTRELSTRLWQQAANKDFQTRVFNYRRLLLSYFRDNQFQYSLKPGALQGDHIDDFLFNQRIGFCAHFASAFAVLMRMQGIPARIVTGYQGGEFNPNGQYFNVYDANAHAWVEFWVTDGPKGFGRWHRVDPTSVIAPNRLTQGIGSLRASDPDFANTPLQLMKSIAWLNSLRLQLQSLDYYWTVWVLDFDKTKQRALLSRWFTDDNWQQTGLMALLLLLMILASLFMFYLWRNRQQTSWQQQQLQRICKRLEKRLRRTQTQTQVQDPVRLTRHRTMTLNEYKDSLTTQFPQLSAKLHLVFQLIERDAYRASCAKNRRQTERIIRKL